MGAKSSSRDGTRITLIAIHTNEGPNPAGDEGRDRTAENLAAYMDGVDVSYHRIVDDDSQVDYVPDDRMCWALRSGNKRSLNLCFTGYARMSRGEWLTHDGMLRRGAAIVRAWCDTHGIPRTRLSPADVGADKAGICGHVDWTVGKRDGTHTDPGAGFPWDVFLGYVNGGQAPSAPSAPPAGSSSDLPYVREGDVSALIWRLQVWMKPRFSYAKGIDPGPGPTSRCGPQTIAAVTEFQERVGISTALPFGIGPRTWTELGKLGFKG